MVNKFVDIYDVVNIVGINLNKRFAINIADHQNGFCVCITYPSKCIISLLTASAHVDFSDMSYSKRPPIVAKYFSVVELFYVLKENHF